MESGCPLRIEFNLLISNFSHKFWGLVSINTYYGKKAYRASWTLWSILKDDLVNINHPHWYSWGCWPPSWRAACTSWCGMSVWFSTCWGWVTPCEHGKVQRSLRFSYVGNNRHGNLHLGPDRGLPLLLRLCLTMAFNGCWQGCCVSCPDTYDGACGTRKICICILGQPEASFRWH